MKYHFIKFPLLFLLLSCSALAQSQAATTDKTEEYEKILSAAFEKRRTVPYRGKFEQVIQILSSDDLLTITKTTLTEFVPPDKERRIETTVYTYSPKYRLVDTIGFPSNTRKETIIIGNLEFVREGTAKWQKLEKTEEKKDVKEESKETRKRDFIITFLGKRNITGKEFDVYESCKIDEKTASSPKMQFWVDTNNGLLVKMDYEILKSADSTTKAQMTYEYDASIKIEAPKVN